MTNDTTDNKTHRKWSIENKNFSIFYWKSNKLGQIFSPANLNLAKGKKEFSLFSFPWGPAGRGLGD